MNDEFFSRLSLSRHAHHRQAHKRTDPELISSLLADEATRVIVLDAGKAIVQNNRLVRFAPSELDAYTSAAQTQILFLGEDAENTSYFALVVMEQESFPLTEDGHIWADLKAVGYDLDDLDAGLFVQALALANWHASHNFSPASGKVIVPAQAGWVLEHVDESSQQVFPRTDPAVIVMVTDHNDRLLLGNNALWEKNRYSLLAGFVEPGESLEAAVIREVFEESGVVVENPTYLGSQPWPFPQSLMLGFQANVAPGIDPDAVVADGEEILNLRWFTKDELKASLAEISLPGPVAIARVMIEHWLGEPLDQNVPWRGSTA